MIFFCKIENGKLILNDKKLFDDFIASKKDTPRIVMKIEKEKLRQSDKFRRYYFGYVLGEIAKETGHDTNYLHGLFKIKFLPRKFVLLKGKEEEEERTTKTLDNIEFMDYVEMIKAWGAEFCNIVWLSLDDYNLI